MPKNKPKISCEALKERKMKRTREGSSQTDEDVFEDDSHGCPKCKSTNARLPEIDEKFERTRAELNPSKMNKKACKKAAEVVKLR